MTIQKKFQLSKEDMVQFHLFMLLDDPEKKKKMRKQFLQAILYNGAIISFLYYFSKGSSLITLLIFFIPMFVILILSFFTRRQQQKKLAEKATDDPLNESWFAEKEIQISETGIQISQEYSKSWVDWKAIVKKGEDSHYWFLFTAAAQAFVIPKKIFSAAERQELENLFATHITLQAAVGYLVK